MPCKQGQCKTLDIIINDKLKKVNRKNMKILKGVLIFLGVTLTALFIGYLIFVGFQI